MFAEHHSIPADPASAQQQQEDEDQEDEDKDDDKDDESEDERAKEASEEAPAISDSEHEGAEVDEEEDTHPSNAGGVEVTSTEELAIEEHRASELVCQSSVGAFIDDVLRLRRRKASSCGGVTRTRR
jgi:hypothetical protein